MINQFSPQRRMGRQVGRQVVQWGTALTIGLTALALMPERSSAADRIYFTFGPLGRSIAISDLRNFADTGETTRQLRWYLNVANVDPEDFRKVLTHEVGLSRGFVNQAAYTIPGEYALYQVGRIIHTKSRKGIVQIKALRSTFVASTIDDSQISILEFLENYPTPEIYVDGVIVARLARDVNRFIDRIEPTIAVIQEFLANLICDCNAPPVQGSAENSTPSAESGSTRP